MNSVGPQFGNVIVSSKKTQKDEINPVTDTAINQQLKSKGIEGHVATHDQFHAHAKKEYFLVKAKAEDSVNIQTALKQAPFADHVSKIYIQA